MSDPISEHVDPSQLGGNPSSHKQTRFPWKVQFGVRTLLLLTTAVAVFVAFMRTRDETEGMRRKLHRLQDVARELIVSDPEQYAIVRHHQTWHDERRWRIHLPEGRRYELSLATENIKKNYLALAVPAGTFQLTPGEHELELIQHQEEDGSWQVLVLVDGKTVLAQKEPEPWNHNLGSSYTGDSPESQQQDVNTPLMIFWRRFGEEFKKNSLRIPDHPCNGILLWIEPVAEE